MSRGFNATLGSGTTDAITTGLAGHSTFRSYSIWTYRNGAGGGSGGRIFDKRVAGSQVELFFNNNAGVTYNFDRAWTTGGSFNIAQPATGSWFHFVITYDATTAGTRPIIYQNGSSVTVTTGTTTTGSPLTNADPYVLGNRTNDSARAWDGFLAEFAVWNRILTASESWAIGNRYSPLFFPNGLVEYIPMIRDNVSLKNVAPTITGTAVQPHPPIIYPIYKSNRTKVTAVVPYSTEMFQAMLAQTQGGAAMIGRACRGVYG